MSEMESDKMDTLMKKNGHLDEEGVGDREGDAEQGRAAENDACGGNGVDVKIF
jgi:hypothetical protein